MSRSNTSGFKGVYWQKAAKKWAVTISSGNSTIYIGIFEDVLQAARAYDEAARKLYGEFACLNFPEADGSNVRSARCIASDS